MSIVSRFAHLIFYGCATASSISTIIDSLCVGLSTCCVFCMWFLVAVFYVLLLIHVYMMSMMSSIVSFVIPVLESMAIQFALPAIPYMC